MLCHQMFSLAIGSNFYIVYPGQPHQRLIFCTPYQLINCIPRKCIAAVSSCTQMYSTVSLGPPCMESPTGISQASPHQPMFPDNSLQNHLLLLPTHVFFIRTFKTIAKHIHIFHSRNDPRPPGLYSDLLSIGPIIYVQID